MGKSQDLQTAVILVDTIARWCWDSLGLAVYTWRGSQRCLENTQYKFGTIGWWAVHTGTYGQGRIRQDLKKESWDVLCMGSQITKAVGGTGSLWLLWAKPDLGMEVRSDLSNASSLSELESLLRQEYAGWRMKRSWSTALSRNRVQV